MKKTIEFLKPVAFALILTLGVAIAQAAWSGPGALPPDGNADAPINVSGTAQTKVGGLILNTGNAPLGLSIPLGKVGIGTLTPTEALQIVGGMAKADDFCLNDDSKCLSASGGSVAGMQAVTGFPNHLICSDSSGIRVLQIMGYQKTAGTLSGYAPAETVIYSGSYPADIGGSNSTNTGLIFFNKSDGSFNGGYLLTAGASGMSACWGQNISAVSYF